MSGDERLWQAFLAGFDESGEGFNGEYVGARFRPERALEARLRPAFEGWLQGRNPDEVSREIWERGVEADG